MFETDHGRKATPVVMLSSLTKEGADKTVEAMEYGAVDFITKPSGSISLDIHTIESVIQSTVAEAAQANISVLSKQESSQNHHSSIMSAKPIQSDTPIVTIGASTGGPRALQQVLTSLPKSFPAPITIVQHMPPGFTKSLADRLNKLSSIHVKEAENGEKLEKGTAYIAPGGRQMEISQNGVELICHVTKKEPINGHEPSVDVLFRSVAQLKKCHPISVILTGMGSDGASGLLDLKKHHPRTIAMSQSEQSCVVYGMPQAAEKTGFIDYVLHLPEIGEALSQKIQTKR
ncbi:chemotaxis response regulator protein-glutamate methylesterase [Gracilibacillus halophilus]|uniref:protein-glutamate methylesterase/protein-glutamine glutaminase n=1 Tax=Gracilibacillus halophilus TaxID=470864 RepID=UPI0026A33CC3